jgi:hypothetical protein
MDKPIFAIFTVTAMTLEVVTELADLGLNVNLVRNYSLHAERNRNAALSVVQLVLRIKVEQHRAGKAHGRKSKRPGQLAAIAQ